MRAFAWGEIMVSYRHVKQELSKRGVDGRVLTAAERTANYRVGRARFLVPAPRDVSPYTVVHAGTNVIFR